MSILTLSPAISRIFLSTAIHWFPLSPDMENTSWFWFLRVTCNCIRENELKRFANLFSASTYKRKSIMFLKGKFNFLRYLPSYCPYPNHTCDIWISGKHFRCNLKLVFQSWNVFQLGLWSRSGQTLKKTMIFFILDIILKFTLICGFFCENHLALTMVVSLTTEAQMT